MPYKDPNKRRAVQRAYMARMRAKKRQEQPPKKRHKQTTEEKQARQAAYYLAHKTKICANTKTYNIQNKTKIRRRKAAYYQAHRTKHLARTKAYAQAHPTKISAITRRHRARKRQAPLNDFTAAQWQEMQETYKHRCAYCDKRAKNHLTQDHLTPLSKGGAHTASNIIPACRSCNSRKRDGDVLTAVQPLMVTLAPKATIKAPPPQEAPLPH